MANIKKYIKKDGTTAYKFFAYLGTDAATGKPIRTNRQGFNTKKEAQLALSRLKIEIEEKGYKKNVRYKYQDVYELWLDQYKNTVKESTLNKTIKLFENHILPIYGNMFMDKITVTHCQKAINEWYKSLKLYKMINNYASTIFKYAISLGITSDNPVTRVTIPVKKDTVMEDIALNFYSKEELQLFFECLKKEGNPKLMAMFRVLAFTGARKGEMLALTWKDINFEQKTIAINKTLTRGLENKLIIQTPKTATSKREIMVDDETLNLLKEWRKQQKSDYFKLGYNTMNPKQLVFSNLRNEFMQPPKVGQKLDMLINKNGLKRITAHGFRHTHCSILFEAGASIKEVQDRLGHSDVQTTMNIYAHVTEKAKEKTAEKFAKYVNF